MSALGTVFDLPQPAGRLTEIAVRPSDTEYQRVRSTYMYVRSPGVVLRARDEADVREAVCYAAHARAATGTRVPFSVRSGGHGMSGSSTNDSGIVLDLSALNRVEIVDPGTGIVRIGAGAVWGDVTQELSRHDLVLTSGNFGDTGVGGLATSGGVGYFVRAHGLTIDRMVATRVVTADGTVHATDAEHGPELFWAVRGGTTQVGIVTEFEFQAVRLPGTRVVHQQVSQLVEDLPGFTQRWGALLSTSPRELTSNLQIRPSGEGRFAVHARNVWAGDGTVAATEVLRAFLDLAPVAAQHASVVPYARVVPTPRWPHDGQQSIHVRNGLVRRLDRTLGEALATALGHEAALVGELRSLGGAMNDVPADATAWAHRDHDGLVAMWAQRAPLDVIDEAWAPVATLTDGLYSAYTADVRPERATDAWPADTGERLRTIAAHTDPNGLFNAGLVLR